MMTTVNAVPVTVAPGDQYEALERGTLDYGYVNLGHTETYRLQEPGPFLCGPSLTMVGHMIVINEDAWQRLPEDIRMIFEEEAAKASARYVDWVNNTEAEAGARLAAAGATIIPIDYLEAWKAATPDLLRQWAEELDDRGKGPEAAEVAAKWRELTAD
jgi:TRAP-type C4-dicarboxylate transport system substrate-binding protein